VLRELGWAGSRRIPAIVIKTTDADSIVAQLNLNQIRTRLQAVSEAEGLRRLVQDHKWEIQEAASAVGKGRSWAHHVMQIYRLNPEIVSDFRSGNISLRQAIVLTHYRDRPEILKMLHKIARSGNISAQKLSVLGKRATKEGLRRAKRLRPRTQKLGKNSWVRFEPIIDGIRAELHLSNNDDISSVMRTLSKLLRKKRS
jgi:ParB family chromosome partitioning protein